MTDDRIRGEEFTSQIFQDPHQAFVQAQKSLSEALKAEDKTTAGEAALTVAHVAIYKADFAYAQHMLDRSPAFLGEVDRHPRYLLVKGLLLFHKEQFVSALKVFFRLYTLALQENIIEALAWSCLCLGELHTQHSMYERSYYYLNQADEASTAVASTELKTAIQLAFTRYHLNLEQFAAARDSLVQARDFLQTSTNNIGEIEADLLSGNILLAERKNEEAIAPVRRALETAETHELDYLQIEALFLIGQIKMTLGRHAAAKLAYQQSLHLAQTRSIQSYMYSNAHALLILGNTEKRTQPIFYYGNLLWKHASAQIQALHQQHIAEAENQQHFNTIIRERDLFKKRSAQLEQENRNIHRLSNIIHTIVASRSIEGSFSALHAELPELVSFDGAALFTGANDSQSVTVLYTAGSLALVTKQVFSNVQEVAESCFSRNEVVHIGPGELESFLPAAVAFPLHSRGELLGVLFFSAEDPEGFSAKELDILSAVCDYLAVSLANQLVVAQLKQANSQLLEKTESLDKALQELQKAHDEIEHLAAFDQLTSLPNRYLFDRRLYEIIHLAQRNGSLFGLFFIDLDDFKAINDTYGHKTGDTALQLASSRMRQVLRKSDVVARYGGDEFIAVFNDIKKVSDLSTIAQKIIDVLNEPLKFGAGRVTLGASIGISVYPHDGTDGTQLVDRADQALYAAKTTGKGTYQYFTAAD
ncbi:MAG: diguanylate cyclase domain-containing protein [Spirochaetota bacterium]